MTQRFLSCGFTCALLALASLAGASEQRETAIVKAVKRARISVVNIHTEKPAPEGQAVFNSRKGHRINGMGTGIVVDEKGYIVTNYHVVADVDLIRTTFDDGSEHEARVIAYDREHDLALIKVETLRPMTVAPLGISSDLMLGEPVMAIGNAFGYNGTITLGIISALGRDVEVNETQSYKNLIQTDASINPGNSGGPLLNVDGDVIGINVAIRAGAQRIGFAIPIDDARRIIARLMSIESLDQNTHGILSKDVKSSSQRHLVVMGAQPESPAFLAGLKPGDIVTKVGETLIVDAVDLERALLGRKTGETVLVEVRRADKTESLPLALANQKVGRTMLNTQVISRANNDDPETDRFWNQLGLRMATLPSHQKDLVAPRYRGGMKVLEVRSGSQAANNGIRQGDILVGLSKWETVSSENVAWILNQPATPGEEGMKFYVIRGQETLFGHLPTTAQRN
ncbi:MAG: trypsin-like peptidase domain-containing protein [Planctomycetaceae bacterium]